MAVRETNRMNLCFFWERIFNSNVAALKEHLIIVSSFSIIIPRFYSDRMKLCDFGENDHHRQMYSAFF